MPAKDTMEHSARGRADRRSASDSDGEGADGDEILLMEQGILESRKNYNNIAALVGIMGEYESRREESMLAAVALCRVFIRLLAQGSLIPKKSLSEKELVVVGWLKDQLSSYKAALLEFLANDELSMTALTLSMKLLKAEGEYMYDNDEYNFPVSTLRGIVSTLLIAGDEDVKKAFCDEYPASFDDIRYYTFKSVKWTMENSDENGSSEELFDNALSFLSGLDGVPQTADDLEDWYIPRPKKKNHNLRSVAQHKKQGQEAWLALTQMVSSNKQRTRILNLTSKVIAPWFMKPELLADFLTNSYNEGGSTSLLALSGVYYLIRERNLDYPSFYPKLYSLLDRNALHSKHRSQLFRHLDTFLASTHLPAVLVASFIKRLSRLSLNAPPGAIVAIVPWIYNQIQRHPACRFMVHRETRDAGIRKDIQQNGTVDPFLPDEADPMETQAIDSSLWEIVQLQSHYHPNVAAIAKIISEPFTKESYNMEDFLDHSYESLLDAELSKDVKKAPAVEPIIPKRIFLQNEEAEAHKDTLVSKLWGFS